MKCFNNIPHEVAKFLENTYGIEPHLFRGYCFIAKYEGDMLRELWLAPSIFSRLDLDPKHFRRLGLKIFNLTKDGKYILTGTFAQVFGGSASRNIVVIKDPVLLKELLRKTFILIEGHQGSIEELEHDNYPFKILRYQDHSLGIVKKHMRGYLSLLPMKFSEVSYM